MLRSDLDPKAPSADSSSMSAEASYSKARRRREVIADHKAKGGLVAAVLPIIYPRELLRSFDILPVEVWGPPRVDTTGADRWLQSYTCGIVRGALSFMAEGGLDEVDLVLVPHACDSLQGLGSVLLDFPLNETKVMTLYLPRSRGTSSVDYLEAEIRALSRRLEKLTGRAPDPACLLRSTRGEEAIDDLVSRILCDMRSLELGGRDLYELLRSREYLPAGEFVELAGPLAEATGRPQGSKGVPLLLSGIVPEPMRVLDVISDAGAVVAADDMACLGRRLLPAGVEEEPYRRMAQRLAGAPPCSTRGGSIAERVAHLRTLAERSGARGVIFWCVKFCEPELFYLPLVREGLEAAGLRTLVLESEVTSGMPHQTLTRIEAFVETLA